MTAQVVSVSRNATHGFSKPVSTYITLLADRGVEGDAHCGVTVKHRSRVAQDATQPNLRQVHLIHAELFDELRAQGFEISPGQMGENITTRHIDLLSLPTGAELRIGQHSVIRITGLRNPCDQLNQFQTGLMAAVLGRTSEGKLVRKAGVMGVVVTGGLVRSGDLIHVKLPAEPYRALERV